MNYFSSNRFPADLMENPELYLGPNYKSVLNFYELYYNYKIQLPYTRETDYFRRLNVLVLEIIPDYIANKLNYYPAAFELIAMHILFERGETLQYLPTIIYRK